MGDVFETNHERYLANRVKELEKQIDDLQKQLKASYKIQEKLKKLCDEIVTGKVNEELPF